MIVLLPNEGIILEIKGGLMAIRPKINNSLDRRYERDLPIKNPVAQARSAQINIFDLFKKQSVHTKINLLIVCMLFVFPIHQSPKISTLWS